MPRNRTSAPPDDLTDEGRAVWRAARRQLVAQGTWVETDRELLEAYVRNVVAARSARRIAEGEPFVPGSQGQLVAHPALRVAAEAEQAAWRYAGALLLTPAARRQHSIRTTGDEDAGLAALIA